ncbi:MAG: TolC family protein [Ignavibacteriales bacterium]|nr:TolC family protein [Ignavibacteriales bacterium]
MNTFFKPIFFILLFSFAMISRSQQDSLVLPESQTLDLQFLIVEALQNNPEIQSAQLEWDMMKTKIPQAQTLTAPELQYMREEMPGFNIRDAMYSRFELMQMFHYPGKLKTMGELARIESEHAHHDHLEKINEVVAKLKMAYFDLWYVQQAMVLNRENIRLMNQFLQSAQTKFSTGETAMQDIFKVKVELAMLDNELVELRQKELSAKAMLMSILNRNEKDTMNYAFIPEEIIFSPTLEEVLNLAIQLRPMLKHDSLGVHEGNAMLSMAKLEYYPDFKVGLRYDNSPMTGFNGWSVSAGITLPFALWTKGKVDAQVEEANIFIDKANSQLTSTRNMIFSNIKSLYYKAQVYKQQLNTYQTIILPQARQSLDASLTAYQNGKTDFLMLLDSYRSLVDLTKMYFMLRMNFEQTNAELDKEVGYQNVAAIKN